MSERERGQKRNALPENDSLLPYLTCVPRIIFVLAHIRLAERKLKEQWITHISTEWVQNSANNKEKTICLARMRMTIAVELLNSGSIDQENHQPNGSVQKPQKIVNCSKLHTQININQMGRQITNYDMCCQSTSVSIWRHEETTFKQRCEKQSASITSCDAHAFNSTWLKSWNFYYRFLF